MGPTDPTQATPVLKAVSTAAEQSTEATGSHRVTLVTGDRVIVDAKRRVVGNGAAA
ncbi:hypothetical protein [Streptomyces sp. NPDC097610]|uniref:hypothetical protein n=1 Tax=Streptomyces sp. NPDC097610 TaxID=3157227 RepID=UPI00332C15BD